MIWDVADSNYFRLDSLSCMLIFHSYLVVYDIIMKPSFSFSIGLRIISLSISFFFLMILLLISLV